MHPHAPHSEVDEVQAIGEVAESPFFVSTIAEHLLTRGTARPPQTRLFPATLQKLPN